MINWINSVRQFYSKPLIDYDQDYYASISRFYYNIDSNESLVDALQYSLELTKKFMLPVLNKVDNLNICIDFLEQFNLPITTIGYDLQSFFNGSDGDDEGALYIKIDNKELKEKWKKILDGTEVVPESTREEIANRNIFFDDPIIHEKAQAELERRKKENTEILRSYGLEV